MTARQTLLIAALAIAACGIAFFVGEFAGRATTATTAYIVNSSPTNCTFIVSAGYNIVSIPCLSTATPVVEVTNNTQVLAMYQYVPGASDPWRVYNPNLPSYVVSDLQHMTRRAGYVTLMNASANVTLVGSRVQYTDVPFTTGWNLVGYPSFTVNNITEALGVLNTSVTNVTTYNQSGFVSYPAELEVFTPGEGYWVNATAPASWTVYP